MQKRTFGMGVRSTSKNKRARRRKDANKVPATVLIIVNAINRISGNIDERYSYSPFGETTILDDVFNPKLNNDRTINAEYTLSLIHI